MIGRSLGPFRIVEQIGAGEMGVVYRAVDERLGREVALKLVVPGWTTDPESRRRFEQEARALSRTAHPAIAIVHDIQTLDETTFLVMEYIPGESLAERLARGPLPEAPWVALGIQLAEGLEAAHRNGVTHRDLKPGNLRLTPDGRLKILDFGLALAAEQPSEPVPLAVPDSLAAGSSGLAGTPAYLAPELLAGEPAGPASDVYALGLVLHECATGVPARAGLTTGALLQAIRSTDPPPPRNGTARLEPRLEALVMACLARDPARRPSAGEVASTLKAFADRRAAQRGRRRLALAAALLALAVVIAIVGIRLRTRPGPFAGPIHAIAVLPLENLSNDPDQDVLAEGLTEELIGQLSHVHALRVTSLTSSRALPAAARSATDIASALGVDALIEGSVERHGDQVRTRVRLVDGSDGAPLWSKGYNGDASRLLELQTRVARAIVAEIRVRLSPEDRARLRREREPDARAHALLLRGRYHWNRGSERDLALALREFKAAVAADTLYADAHAALAGAWASAGLAGLYLPVEAAAHARAEAHRAIALDPDLGEAHTVLGNVLHNFDWDWAGAVREYRLAIALNPSDAIAHHHLAHLLAQRGQFDSARVELHRALALDPVSLPVVMSGGVIEYFARRYPEALAQFEAAAVFDSSSAQLHRNRAGVLERLGREAAAVDEFARSFSAREQHALAAALRGAYARGGRRGATDLLIGGLQQQRAAGQHVPAVRLAELYALTGRREPALQWLERALAERDPELNRLAVDPIFDTLRKEPRFQAVLASVGLPRLALGS